MQVMYQSTRGKGEPVTASQAILKGLSEDGGLFVPTSIPSLDVSMEELSQMSYQETAYQVMSRLLTDFTEEELRTCINSAYDKKFDKNKNGIMEDDEKLEEQAYIRYLAEKDDEGEEEDDFDNGESV